MKNIFFVTRSASVFIVVALSMNLLIATKYSDKTFMVTRPILDNLVMRTVAQPHAEGVKAPSAHVKKYGRWGVPIVDFKQASPRAQANRAKPEQTNKPFLQFSTMYQKSTNTHGLGQYFGSFATSTQTYRDYINVVNQDDNPADPGKTGVSDLDNIWAQYIVHNAVEHSGSRNYSANLAGAIRFNPEQEQLVARFDFHAGLDCITKWLFLEVAAPVAYVRNSMRLQSMGGLTAITLLNNTDTPSPAAGKTLLDYFQGHVSDLEADSSDQQQPLTSAKMGGAVSATRIADLAVKLGYELINEKNKRYAIGLLCTIPTGNRVTGEYVFEPTCGNGRHWELGGCFDAQARIYEKNNLSFDVQGVLNLKYILQGTERRTLGIKKSDGTPIPFGQYYLAGQVDSRPLFPLANVLTQDLLVSPGAQCEGLVNFSCNVNHLMINVGYNVFVRHAEDVALKNSCPDGFYGIAKPGHLTASNDVAFLYAADAGGRSMADLDGFILGTKLIGYDNLNFDSVSEPNIVTHKLYLKFDYLLHQKAIAFGGACEFASANKVMNNYSLWASLGLTF